MKATLEWIQERIGKLEAAGVNDFFEFCCEGEQRNRVETRDGCARARVCVCVRVCARAHADEVTVWLCELMGMIW